MIVALRVLLGVGVAVLFASILYAAMSADFFASFAQIGAMPWGLVSLIDLYLGFAVLAVLIAFVEPPLKAVGWVVALFILGNVVGAAWFAWRLPTLVAAFRR